MPEPGVGDAPRLPEAPTRYLPLGRRGIVDSGPISARWLPLVRCQNPLLGAAVRARLAGVKLDPKVREAFRAFGRIGGKTGGRQGGTSRMAQLTATERRALAKKAAAARWKKQKG